MMFRPRPLRGSTGSSARRFTLGAFAAALVLRAVVGAGQDGEDPFDPFAPTPAPAADGASATPPAADYEVRARLVAATTAIVPGEPITLGLLLEHGPGWHTYYRYPGIGQPTSLAWSLPEGFSAGPIQWPVPEVTPFFGQVTYAYHDRIVLPVEVTPPSTLEAGTTITFRATAKWLQCKEACVQNGADVEITLPVGESAGTVEEHAELFADARSLLPVQSDAWTISAAWEPESEQISLRLEPGAGAAELVAGQVYYFPDDAQIKDVEVQALELRTDGSYALLLAPRSIEKGPPARLQGAVHASGGWTPGGEPLAMPVSVVVEGAPAAEDAGTTPGEDATDAAIAEPPPTVAAGEAGKFAASTRAAIKEMRSWGVRGLGGDFDNDRGLLRMILFAVLGGIILNIMPCVFPVLGIKIMGFVNQAGEDRAKIRLHGLVFAAGVILSIWALVGVLFLVRSLGSQVGWGFQLQNPGFLAFIIVLLFLFGLSLSGVFEIGSSMTAVGGKLQQKSGMSGSFFSGLLTVLVATPCTGPFMGPALGYAFSVPPFHAYLVFTALAVGVALPYVVLSFFPSLIGKLPRPGPWMETFKQFMAFPLYATVVWLVGVYAKVVSVSGMTWLMAGLVAAAMGAWLLGRYGTPVRKPRTRWIARVAAAASLLAIGWAVHHGVTAKRSSDLAFAQSGADATAAQATIQSHGMTWVPFSPESVVEHRKKGRTVFIDFTADW